MTAVAQEMLRPVKAAQPPLATESRERPRRSNMARLTNEQKDFLRRRTRPFLDSVGVERSLTLLLEEAYLQGLRDAVQVMEERAP